MLPEKVVFVAPNWSELDGNWANDPINVWLTVGNYIDPQDEGAAADPEELYAVEDADDTEVIPEPEEVISEFPNAEDEDIDEDEEELEEAEESEIEPVEPAIAFTYGIWS